MPTSQAFWAHPTAQIDPGATIGTGTKIWHFSHICGTDVSIGQDCSFGQNTYVGTRVKIGRGVRVQNNVSIYDLVELEDFVFCGPSMVFTNVVNPRAHVSRKLEFKKTLVRHGATLGANCTVVCGTEIGRFAFIAAGAVVTRNVPAFAIMQGVPAKFAGWICHCGVRLPREAQRADQQTDEQPDQKHGHGKSECGQCHSQYKIDGKHCVPIQLKNCFEEK